MQWWLAYLAIGLAVGFFAGLLGIGGGAVVVPLLVLVFSAQGLPSDQIVHLALGWATAVCFQAATHVFPDLRPKRRRGRPGGLGLFTAGATVGGGASLVAAGGA